MATSTLLAGKEKELTLEHSLKKQARVEKLFLVNAGLDVAYIAGGLYMKERSKNSFDNRDKLKGYGESVIVQGAALLLFDGLMYALHTNNGKPLFDLASKVAIGAGPAGFGVSIGL